MTRLNHANESASVPSKSKMTSRYCMRSARSLGALALFHQPHEPLEQVAAVTRTGRGLRVILHREHWLVFQRNAAVRSVEQRHMGFDCVGRQRLAVDREAVVHRGDLDLAGGEILHRMVRAVMTLVHLHGLGADRY